MNALLGGKPVIEWVREAAQQIRGVKRVRVLWAEDFPHIPENDVLGRYREAMKDHPRIDGFIRLTGDCPLLDPGVCNLVVDAFQAEGVEYASNVFPRRTFPDGLDCEIFTPGLLRDAHVLATDDFDREHVTPYMQRHAAKIASVELPIDWSTVRLTLDTREDLAWLETASRSPRSGSPALVR